jgi:hypothetical protein
MSMITCSCFFSVCVHKTVMSSCKLRPTKGALDAGDSAAFSSIFPWTVRPLVPAVLAQAGQAGFEFFLFPNRIHGRPRASNAHR